MGCYAMLAACLGNTPPLSLVSRVSWAPLVPLAPLVPRGKGAEKPDPDRPSASGVSIHRTPIHSYRHTRGVFSASGAPPRAADSSPIKPHEGQKSRCRQRKDKTLEDTRGTSHYGDPDFGPPLRYPLGVLWNEMPCHAGRMPGKHTAAKSGVSGFMGSMGKMRGKQGENAPSFSERETRPRPTERVRRLDSPHTHPFVSSHKRRFLGVRRASTSSRFQSPIKPHEGQKSRCRQRRDKTLENTRRHPRDFTLWRLRF